MTDIILIIISSIVAILLAWTGLSYSKQARKRYPFLSYSDGKKHIILSIVVILVLFGASIQILTILNKSPYTDRDRIAANQLYFEGVGLFLARFRLNLTCNPAKDDPRINEVFHINEITKGVEVSKIDSKIIGYLFSTYDFDKPAIYHTPVSGTKHITNKEWLIIDLRILKSACDKVLLKYGSTCNPVLVNRVEMLRNRTENLIGPFGLNYENPRKENGMGEICDFFDQIRMSQNLIDKIKINVKPLKEPSSSNLIQ